RIETPVAELIDDKIVLYQQIFFAEASAELLEASEPVLQVVLDIIMSDEHDGVNHLLIEGHTNARGSRGYNQRLSEQRARSVSLWLIKQGLPEDTVLTRGFGEDRPLVRDSHPDAMAINRRVEFTVLRAGRDEPQVPDTDTIPETFREQEP
ncbi:MAG: OOP family OmpA-OmpF porin, partial [Myxococcota bacterium]